MTSVNTKLKLTVNVLPVLYIYWCVVNLTSLPMQRCCIPTLFSHLWWRLILQALQRRPCFAVFPARNTTCLAVVPETHRKKESRFAFTSSTGLESTRTWKKKKEKGWRKWKILLRITSPMEQFSKCDTQYTLLQSRFDHPDHYWDIANT